VVALALVCGAAVAQTPRPGQGALDLEVRPRSAEVWVDGFYVGTANQYDGYPRYLWLDAGEHRLVFYKPGYRTAAREFTVHSDAIVRVRTRLDEGESRPPEELFEKPTDRAEARIEADRERRARAEAATAAAPVWTARWREQSSEPAVETSEPGRLRVSVEPADAAVYLDGRFVGTGSELAALHAGLLVAAGSHRLEVARPGYRSRSEEFELAADEERLVEIALEAQPD
jgi:hypothetical protein